MMTYRYFSDKSELELLVGDGLLLFLGVEVGGNTDNASSSNAVGEAVGVALSGGGLGERDSFISTRHGVLLFDHGIGIRIGEGLGISISVGDPLLESVHITLGGAVDLGLELSDLSIELGLHLLLVDLVLSAKIRNGVVKDTLGIVAGLTDLLLGEGGVGLVLLTLKILPVLSGSLEPIVDNLGVVAVADESFVQLGGELLHGLLDRARLFRLRSVGGGVGAINLAAGISAVLEVAGSLDDHLVSVHAAVEGNRVAELVEAERLRVSLRLLDSLSEVLLNIGHGLPQRLTVDVSVVDDEVGDLLKGLDVHLILLLRE